ncbi:tyrosine-type recombinase/integrase [Lactococcus lactis]|uniref:tyrosine-type recombinase/integrase n=1 Tax=Lactococcus lactis TaxID=1358 RepID=UPI0012932FA6|nr:site-specific integrase [Lactococcus lactis]MQQ79947.1 tyrosine-type recombinase/integrase [Lactococcus lactis]
MSKNYPNCNYDKKGQPYYQITLPNGKQKKGRFNPDGSHFRTLKEAWEEANRVRQEFNKNNGVYIDSNMTYNEYMDKAFMPHYKAKNGESTYETALAPYKKIREKIGRIPLSEIDVRVLDQFQTQIFNEESSVYADKIWSNLRYSLERAFKLSYIKENPARRLDRFPVHHVMTDYWKPSEFKQAIDVFDLTDYVQRMHFLMVWCYYWTGLRVNELLCLNWNDVSFSSKRLFVRKTFVYTKAEKWHIQNYLKTAGSYRSIELDDLTLKHLKDWKKIQAQIGNQGYIFSKAGEATYMWTLNTILKKIASDSGIKKVTGRGLRHSHASYLINSLNRDVLYVQKRLGHSSAKTTLDTYSHWFNGSKEEVSAVLTESMKRMGF